MNPSLRSRTALRSLSALAATLALASVALAGAPSTAASSSAGIRVPNDATLRIAGRGFGHGHGMSQYGAEGAARQGLSAQQIVRFYYPHTRRGDAGGPVKVLISADTDDDTTVVNQPGLAVHDLGDGSTRMLPTHGTVGRASRWRLSSGAGGATKLSYRTDAWHVWTTLAGDGEFRAPKPIALVVGPHQVTYRGSLQSRTPASGRATDRITVDKVSLEGYVRGVIAREMPASWHPAALRAQAIAARTYASYEVAHSTTRRYDLCDTSLCQVYGGMSAEYPSTDDAVAATAGQVRTYGGEPAFTQFSASNGGWTAAGGQPYLVAEKDPYDRWSGNPYRSWTTTVSSRSVEKTWPVLGNLTSITIDSRDGNGKWGGRVVKLTLHGSKKANLPISGVTFQLALGLRSTWFDISVGP